MLLEHQSNNPSHVIRIGSTEDDVSYEEFLKSYVVMDDHLVPKAVFFKGMYTTQEELDTLPGGWKDVPPEPYHSLWKEHQKKKAPESEELIRNLTRVEEIAFGKRVKASVALGVAGVVLAILSIIILMVELVYIGICALIGTEAVLWPLAASAGCIVACALCHIVDAARYRKFEQETPLVRRS